MISSGPIFDGEHYWYYSEPGSGRQARHCFKCGQTEEIFKTPEGLKIYRAVEPCKWSNY